jgi:ribosomal protein RSM22 (predicted rRNA methylase)
VLPRPLERLLDRFLAERFPQATPRRLASDVERLSDAFTAERSELPGSYLNHPPSRSAYLAFFHPQQVLRGMAALAETRARAEARGLWPQREPLRVLDLGAGLGAMSQALLASGPLPPAVEFTLVDHQKSALSDGRELLLRASAALRPDAPAPLVRTADERVQSWLERARAAQWRYDVILVGALLNEIHARSWGQVSGLHGLLDRTRRPGGVAVIVEPAIPEVARSLMEFRQHQLLRTTTIAPCTHGKGCPLLLLRKDWCFTTVPAKLPPRVREMAARLRHQTDEVRFALWAAAGGADAAPFEHDTARFGRVVSDPVLGGQVLCSDGERQRLPAGGRPPVRGTLLRR